MKNLLKLSVVAVLIAAIGFSTAACKSSADKKANQASARAVAPLIGDGSTVWVFQDTANQAYYFKNFKVYLVKLQNGSVWGETAAVGRFDAQTVFIEKIIHLEDEGIVLRETLSGAWIVIDDVLTLRGSQYTKKAGQTINVPDGGWQ